MDERLSNKQVNLVVIVVIAAIAFIESSGAIWTWGFWRNFLENFVGYIIVAVVALVLFEGLIFRKTNRE